MLEECDEVEADIGNICRPATPSVSPHLPEVCVTDMEDQDLFQMTDFGTPRLVKLRINFFLIDEIIPVRSDDMYGSLEEEEEDFPTRRNRLTPEPELPSSSSYKTRRMSLISPIPKSRISPRRLSVSLVESLGQLDIPFKQKRKVSAPVISSVDQKTVDNMKLRLIRKKEVKTVPDWRRKTT